MIIKLLDKVNALRPGQKRDAMHQIFIKRTVKRNNLLGFKQIKFKTYKD